MGKACRFLRDVRELGKMYARLICPYRSRIGLDGGCGVTRKRPRVGAQGDMVLTGGRKVSKLSGGDGQNGEVARSGREETRSRLSNFAIMDLGRTVRNRAASR